MRRRDIPSPKATPRAMETEKLTRKIPMPWKIDLRYTSVLWNRDRVLGRARNSAGHEIKIAQEVEGYILIHYDTNSII